MTVLLRYICQTFLGWFLGVVSAVVATIALFDMTDLLRRASTRQNLGVTDLLEVMLLKLPFITQQLLPFAVFFAALLTFWRLNRNSELIVLRASGISMWQCVLPLACFAMTLGMADLLLLNPLSSVMMDRYEHKEALYFKGKPNALTVGEDGIWLRQGEGTQQFILHIHKIYRDQNELEGITLFRYKDNDKFIERVSANKAKVTNTSIVLQEGWAMKPGDVVTYQPIYEIPVALPLDKLQESSTSPETLSFWVLPSFTRLLEKSGLSSLKHSLYWHSLLARVFWMGAMVILAATCSLGAVRVGRTAALMVVGAASGFVLYFIRDITYSMGLAGMLPVFVAAWVPAGISALLGCAVLFHLEDG